MCQLLETYINLWELAARWQSYTLRRGGSHLLASLHATTYELGRPATDSLFGAILTLGSSALCSRSLQSATIHALKVSLTCYSPYSYPSCMVANLAELPAMIIPLRAASPSRYSVAWQPGPRDAPRMPLRGLVHVQWLARLSPTRVADYTPAVHLCIGRTWWP